MSSIASTWTRRIVTPGAFSFAALFAVDSLARSLLATVIPLEVLRALGNARDVSVFYTVVGCAGLTASLFIPAMVRRFRPRWVYTLGAVMLILAAGSLALGTFVGLTVGMLVRTFGAACLLNALNLYIMAYIRKRDMARSEPLRAFMAAGSWTLGPSLGVWLYREISPLAVYGLSAVCAALLIFYFWRLRIEHGPALATDQPVAANPAANVRRFWSQPRLRLAYVLNFCRETFWVTFFIYGPVYVVTAGGSETMGALLASSGAAMLFTTPLMGWIARRFGLRRFMAVAYLACAAAMVAVAVVADNVILGASFLVLAALAGVALDSIGMVPYLRAVKARERPEMTMVFSSYRDISALLPIAIYTVLLSVFDLRAVFVALALALAACSRLCRWIPRGM
jgi:predicted MFS family arabinose efflux permease